MRQRIARFVESKPFTRFVFAVIILNTIVLGLETSQWLMDHVALELEILNWIFIGVYVVEAILKLIAYHLGYFKSGWNIFDFIIVVTSLIPAGGIFSGLRILRVFRVLRALRLVSGIGPLRKIVSSIIRSLPGVGWTVLLMMLVYYVYSIIGIHLFRPEFPERFGTLVTSFGTLFELTTLEGWQDIVKPVTELHPAAWVFFISFIVIASFILLNVVLGIVVDSLELAREDQREEQWDDILADGQVTADEALVLEIQALKESLAKVESLAARTVARMKAAQEQAPGPQVEPEQGEPELAGMMKE